MHSHGGVGRNVAEALARLAPATPVLVSAVGGDQQGQSILAGCCHTLDTSLVRVLPHSHTATYTAILDRQVDLYFLAGTGAELVGSGFFCVLKKPSKFLEEFSQM